VPGTYTITLSKLVGAAVALAAVVTAFATRLAVVRIVASVGAAGNVSGAEFVGAGRGGR
jgi:hypothetical protein